MKTAKGWLDRAEENLPDWRRVALPRTGPARGASEPVMMRKIVLSAAAALLLTLTATPARAQVAAQRIILSLVSYDQDDATNSNATVTNQDLTIGTAMVTGGNIARAISYDVFGPGRWTNVIGASLWREVNLATGAEGIYLRFGAYQTNVSRFFTNASGNFYTNDFTGEVTNFYAGLTNNFIPDNPIHHGTIHNGPGGETSSFVRSHGFFFFSVATTNLQLNLLATGFITPTNIAGRYLGTRYAGTVDMIGGNGMGTFLFNGSTNIFDVKGLEPPSYHTGSAQGAFSTGPPVFLAVPGP